ncbi:PREDICTED: uncharacterized protein LOC106300940 isoform X5 [Brassica oleracea var. oleracea]|uniref:uncharacterized protein LOC106300940 isoform X5 n=1 Tax=Brassica oleracea var. oleracea TaxID=109376 RepID=UPI0006A6BDF6|nr:PREDICTED: uncharacterized protein LOC106300940 isoform X5 [Brassica oleracea var. oleracea]
MEIEEGAKVPLFLNGAESYSIDADTPDTSLLQLCFDSMENRFMCSSSHQQERNGCGYTCRATCCGERATRCGRHLSHERKHHT